MCISTSSVAHDSNSYKPTHRIFPTDCWEIHSLGTLGGPFSSAVDLNNSGQVVGNAATEPRILDSADPPYTLVHAYISAPNGGALTEILAPGYFGGSATAINQAGQVVGDTTIGRSFSVSFITDPGGGNVRVTLGFTYVRDINDVGETLWDIWFPFFKAAIGPNEQSDLQGTDLTEVAVPVMDPYNAYISAVALNNAGQVAVNVSDVVEGQHLPNKAYRWSAHDVATLVAPDSLGSRAIQMNEAGQIVGMVMLKNSENGNPAIEQAFVTRRYVMPGNANSLIMLGAPGDGNSPTDINNWSQIIGTKPVNGQSHGYVTPPLNVTRHIDLNTLEEVARDGWTNIRPAAINDRGQIAGTGTLNGHDLAFLLTPKSVLAYLPRLNGKQPQCYRGGTL